MSKGLIIGLVVAVFGLGGGVAYVLSQDNKNNASETSQESSSAKNPIPNNDTPTFDPVAMTNQSFVATMKGEASGGETYDATIEFDGEATTYFSGAASGQSIKFYITPDRYITCSDGSCIEYSDRTNLPQTPEYNYDEETFNDYRDMATYKGEAPCPDGTCQAWEVVEDGYTTTIYINSDGRVSQLDTSGPEGEFTITYEYKDVNITLPQNVQSFPL